MNLSQEKIAHVFNFFDVDGNKEIDALEFIQIVFPGIADDGVGRLVGEGSLVAPKGSDHDENAIAGPVLHTRANRVALLEKTRSQCNLKGGAFAALDAIVDQELANGATLGNSTSATAVGDSSLEPQLGGSSPPHGNWRGINLTVKNRFGGHGRSSHRRRGHGLMRS